MDWLGNCSHSRRRDTAALGHAVEIYRVADEAETDDHFRDFLQTISFLHLDERRTSEFKSKLDRYRNAVFSQSSNDGADLGSSKDAVEDALRQVMVRTERLAVSADRNGMLCEVAMNNLHLRPSDVGTFVALADVAAAIKQPDVTEYLEIGAVSAQFHGRLPAEGVVHRVGCHTSFRCRARQGPRKSPGSLLNWGDVERYRALDPANARLRSLLGHLESTESWKLLWLPAALSYYEEDEAFTRARERQLTKRLIFSAWQVVPKVVAALLSYEAERLMFGVRPEIERPNTLEERERISQLLRFSRADSRLTGMPVMALLYPSITLAELGDPLEVRRTLGRAPGREELLSVVEERIRSALDDAFGEPTTPGAPDEAWYWAAPVLLDVERHANASRPWLTNLGSRMYGAALETSLPKDSTLLTPGRPTWPSSSVPRLDN